MIEPLEAPEFAASSELSVLNEILLADIWRAFVIYDRSATNTQKRFMFLRLLILRLSVIVTLLAILHSQFPDLLKINTLFWVKFSPTLPSQVDLLQVLVIVAPITVSILLAGTIKFGRGVSWILLRASAETIKQEIYRYRTQVGNYSDPVSRDINFAQVIQTINERLMKTQVNQGCLAWSQVKIADRESLLTTIHGAIGEQDKDPFSALTADQYREYRALDQLAWYRKKTLDLDKKWQQWQWSIYVLGGVGTFLAAIQWDVWIAVSNAIAASILSFLEFRRFDGTLIGYNQTATNLENILCWWHALTKESQADRKNVEKLVESSEKVIQAETTGWVQEMKDAMADLYKADEERLAKEAKEISDDGQVVKTVEIETKVDVMKKVEETVVTVKEKTDQDSSE
jgi:hypothetical protein